MLNTEEDTEWNDILRQKGILPPKPAPVVEEPPSPPNPESLLESLTVDQLQKRIELAEDEADEEDAKFLEQYRRKRLAMMQEEAAKAKYGYVREISKAEWKSEVTDAGDVYVVIHIAQNGHPICALVDTHLTSLARKFPDVKFLRGEACLCIPNYPESNLPSLLIYQSGDLKHQLIGPESVGGKTVSAKGLEWRLGQLGVLKTKLTEDPTKRINLSTVSRRTTNRIGRKSSDDDDDDGTDSDD
ncbi:Phosducin like 3 [Fasciolopsis buskii]|uniref:Phosducin like 3 n=1 Tax=Fasciolopsis buskii TaxID=27845 RepID=A0A8E0RW37_9TREM|nr:Phosducin like 3 [Fasciolopsis buski]